MRHRLIIVSCGLIASACAREAPVPFYSFDECRRIDLIDENSGALIIGAEDIAYQEKGDRLIVSAYDRRATEKAARHSRPPEGGLYTVALDEIFSAQKAISIERLIDPAKIKNGLRPHGVSVANGAIAFVNRGYVQDGRRWRMSPSLVQLSAHGDIDNLPAHCAANDAALASDGHVLTRDHTSCGGVSRFIENAFARNSSGAYFSDGTPLADDISFANGVVAFDAGYAVAATRGKAVHIFRPGENSEWRRTKIKTSGAPDNLSVARDGSVIAALHPDLFRLALNRKLGKGKAGSRIVRIDVEKGETALLFDDPRGVLYSAATIGVETARGLVVGSVTDSGVLVCEKS